MRIEVVYARPERQVLLDLEVEPGTTIGQAILASGLLRQFPEIDLAQNKVGIFGSVRKLDHILREHERVEIYRPLVADPMEARRKRAAGVK